jgi:hypothetical protein
MSIRTVDFRPCEAGRLSSRVITGGVIEHFTPCPQPSEEPRTTNRTIAALALLALGLGGCATSRADPLPNATPRPMTPPQAHANPQLEGVVGHMLAVDTLLRQVDGLLQSGYAAQVVQLPDSAQANFSDASRRLGRARRVFFGLGTAGPYQLIADSFGHSIAWYSSAAAEGSSHSTSSQRAAADARTYLARAEAALNSTPEASQPAAIAAESAALQAVTPPSAKPRRVAHHRSAHRAPQRRPRLPARSSRTSGSHGSTTIKIVIATTPTLTPTPTSRPTATPAPAPTPRPVVRLVHHHTRHHSVDQRLATALRGLARQRSSLDKATRTVASCRRTLAAMSRGADPTGSSGLLDCLSQALDSVNRINIRTSLRSSAFAAQRASLTAVHANVTLALAELQKAVSDVLAIDLQSTQTDVDAAALAIERAQAALSSIEHGLKTAR